VCFACGPGVIELGLRGTSTLKLAIAGIEIYHVEVGENAFKDLQSSVYE
jgi:hypothetical protein